MPCWPSTPTRRSSASRPTPTASTRHTSPPRTVSTSPSNSTRPSRSRGPRRSATVMSVVIMMATIRAAGTVTTSTTATRTTVGRTAVGRRAQPPRPDPAAHGCMSRTHDPLPLSGSCVPACVEPGRSEWRGVVGSRSGFLGWSGSRSRWRPHTGALSRSRYQAHARWSRRAGDPARGAHGQDAVRAHDEPPPASVGLQPVVPAAQAAEIRAVRRAAVAVRDDVVEIGPRGTTPAAGMSAGAVPDADVAVLGRGGPVPVHRWRAIEDRAPAVVRGVVRTAAADEPLQFGTGETRPEGARVAVHQGDVEAAGERRLQASWAEGIEIGQELLELGGGDRMPAHLARLDVVGPGVRGPGGTPHGAVPRRPAQGGERHQARAGSRSRRA